MNLGESPVPMPVDTVGNCRQQGLVLEVPKDDPMRPAFCELPPLAKRHWNEMSQMRQPFAATPCVCATSTPKN